MKTEKRTGAAPESANPVNDGKGKVPPAPMKKSANPVNDISANPVNDTDPRGDKGKALGQTAGS
jgi:hypothetical protein